MWPVYTGRSAARLARSNRDAEVRGSNPRAPTHLNEEGLTRLSGASLSASPFCLLPQTFELRDIQSGEIDARRYESYCKMFAYAF